MEIPIENHKAALAAQQAEFDAALAAKEATIAGLQATATKDKADAAAEKAAAIEARNKAVADLGAMTAQDQQNAAAVVAALNWATIDAEYADLQTKLAANAAKYDTAKATLTALANSINEPFVARQLAALEKAEADLKKQREKLAG